jgi:hypothetical protein
MFLSWLKSLLVCLLPGLRPGSPSSLPSVNAREKDSIFFSPLSRFTTTQLCQRLVQRPSHDVSLHTAIREGNPDKLRELLEKRVDLDGADGEGQTALHLALRSGSPEMVWALLEAGALPDSPCLPLPSLADLFFALFRLVKIFSHYLMAVWIASKLGIDGSSAQDRDSIRILSIVLVAMLLFYILASAAMVKGPSIGEAATAFRGRSEFMILILLDSGFQPRYKDMSLLWIDAARKGYTGVCRRLAEMGWDIDTPFEYVGSPQDRQLITTALLCACAASHKDLVLFLLHNGADPMLVDSWGRSCPLLALMGGNDDESSSSILQTLLSTQQPGI